MTTASVLILSDSAWLKNRSIGGRRREAVLGSREDRLGFDDRLHGHINLRGDWRVEINIDGVGFDSDKQ